MFIFLSAFAHLPNAKNLPFLHASKSLSSRRQPSLPPNLPSTIRANPTAPPRSPSPLRQRPFTSMTAGHRSNLRRRSSLPELPKNPHQKGEKMTNFQRLQWLRPTTRFSAFGGLTRVTLGLVLGPPRASCRPYLFMSEQVLNDALRSPSLAGMNGIAPSSHSRRSAARRWHRPAVAAPLVLALLTTPLSACKRVNGSDADRAETARAIRRLRGRCRIWPATSGRPRPRATSAARPRRSGRRRGLSPG